MKDFNEFSTSDIADMAKEASDEARKKALDSGLEIAGKDLETGKKYLEKLGTDGQVIRRPMPEGYIDGLKTENDQ